MNQTTSYFGGLLFAAVNLSVTAPVGVSVAFAASPSKEGFSQEQNDSVSKEFHVPYSKPGKPHAATAMA